MTIPMWLIVEKVDPFESRHITAKRVGQRQQELLDKQESRAGIIEHVRQFRRGQPDIEREENRVSFEHTVVSLEQAMAIGAEKRNSIAALDAFCAQCTR